MTARYALDDARLAGFEAGYHRHNQTPWWVSAQPRLETAFLAGKQAGEDKRRIDEKETT